ncbi:chemotaxis protein CheW [Leptolyngbya ohadii]|uniref:chemotaxis protein CheW n=1 Tax=Leptolyngbya ohadii TaxID=1962290 RepID=UPI000B59C086|nr:chemotaxis protein CheW [Leptolyngbya ohadii]
MQFGETPTNKQIGSPQSASSQSASPQINAADNFNGLTGLLFDVIPPETRERLLRFVLGNQDSVLLPLEQIIEVLKVEFSDVLPIPEMPRSVLGICYWRGEMLWLIDFNHFVSYSSPVQQGQCLSQFNVIVAETRGESSQQANSQQVNSQQANSQQAIGLIVTQVQEIELHDLQQLQPAPIGLFSPDLLPLVQGILPGSGDAVLDLQSLMQCPIWKKHPKGEASMLPQ